MKQKNTCESQSICFPKNLWIYTAYIQNKEKNDYVYWQIARGVYGLSQAGILANKLLEERLAVQDHYKLPHTPGLSTHKTRAIWFTLTVDDFGVKYIDRKHAKHLMSVLKEHCKMDEDWEGDSYCGITLK